MSEFFIDPSNYPFFSAAFILVTILCLEVVAMLFGASLNGLFDSSHDLNLDSNPAESSAIASTLSWIRYKKVPLLITLVLVLMLFSVIGYSIQLLVYHNFDVLLPYYVSVPISFILTVPLVRISSVFIGKYVLKEESSAISESSFSGKIAVINQGKAQKGFPAEAKLTDSYGQLHYIMVEPDAEGDIYEEGTQIVILEKKDYYFTSIKLDL
jgi:hypothetical protein